MRQPEQHVKKYVFILFGAQDSMPSVVRRFRGDAVLPEVKQLGLEAPSHLRHILADSFEVWQTFKLCVRR